MGPAAVPVSVVRAVRDAGSARQSGATPHFHFGFGLSEIIHQHSCLISQSRQSKQSWHVEQSLHATAPPHAPDDPDTPTHHAQWEAIAHVRASRRKQLAAQMGGEAESHTHRSSTDTLHVSARSMWPALSPRSYRRFNGRVRPRAAPNRSRRETSEPHAMRACAMAPLAPCLRQID